MESELRQKAAQVLRNREELSPHFAEDPPTYEQLRPALHELRLRETELERQKGELLQTVDFFRSEIEELQRRESERLASALRDRDKQHVESLGLMAGGISHELNNIFCGRKSSPLRLCPADHPVSGDVDYDCLRTVSNNVSKLGS